MPRTGKVRRYQHIDNGKCFSCNGAGWTWSEVGPPRELRPVPLFVTLRDVQGKRLSTIAFATSAVTFKKSYESLLSAMGGEPDTNSTISIGDTNQVGIRRPPIFDSSSKIDS